MLGTCEALKSDASEIAAFASQPLCINYQVISENPTIYISYFFRTPADPAATPSNREERHISGRTHSHTSLFVTKSKETDGFRKAQHTAMRSAVHSLTLVNTK